VVGPLQRSLAERYDPNPELVQGCELQASTSLLFKFDIKPIKAAAEKPECSFIGLFTGSSFCVSFAVYFIQNFIFKLSCCA
jgi:hypothetical protein